MSEEWWYIAERREREEEKEKYIMHMYMLYGM